MNLGAFLAVDALERQLSSDDISQVAGLGLRLPVTAAVLAIRLLSLAGFPPFGGFVGKTMLFGAAIAAGWTWLAVIMLVNIAMSLYYYVRVLAPMYFQPSPGVSLKREPTALRFVLIVLGIRDIHQWRIPAGMGVAGNTCVFIVGGDITSLKLSFLPHAYSLTGK